MMLNLSGGESVDDLRLLERDEGLGRVLLLGSLTGCGGTAGRSATGGAGTPRGAVATAVFSI